MERATHVARPRLSAAEVRRILVVGTLSFTFVVVLTVMSFFELRHVDSGDEDGALTAAAGAGSSTAMLSAAATYSGTDEVVPAEVQELVRTEVAPLKLEYPAGGGPVGPSQLVRGLAGAQVTSTDSQRIVLVNHSAEEEIVLVLRAGDLASAAVQDWQCQWVGEYLAALDADDHPRRDAAAGALAAQPDLPGRPTGVDPAVKVRTEVIAPLLEGRDQGARDWVTYNCGR
ncbi:hypothetical protein I6B53_08275 [Schaalia sp. 19OD2882]|uniref:hypothetical protein n=1 Tax=Schaalia sp. 19OD2882 TaxID=2794089 RepID=UPI001C1EC4A3|nr:hypothetical protein [Schaalia sp. 19OD2882]QWW19110.1 hypothetical protein I6B53_08275 [Schaalia sp. 19OD2882]